MASVLSLQFVIPRGEGTQKEQIFFDQHICSIERCSQFLVDSKSPFFNILWYLFESSVFFSKNKKNLPRGGVYMPETPLRWIPQH